MTRQFNEFINLFPELVCVVGTDGVIVKANAILTDMLGYTEEQFVNHAAIDFVHPDDIDRTQEALEKLFNGDTVVSFQNRIRHQDGHYKMLEWSSYLSHETGMIHSVARDVTENLRLLKLSQLSEQVSGVGSWELDMDTLKVYWSAVTHKIHKTNPDTFQPTLETALKFYPGTALDTMKQCVEHLMQQGRAYDIELPFINADGESSWVRATADAEFRDGYMIRVYGTFQDISKQKQIEKDLVLLANTDALTGLYNRRYFFNELDKMLCQVQRYDVDVSILLIDIDFFKQINDRFGHHAGDEILISFARLLSMRQSDIIARIGGEEFALILPHTKQSDAKNIAQRLCSKVRSKKFVAKEQTLSMTISIGVTSLIKTDDSSSLMLRVDKALYQAKEQGRNQVFCL